MVCLPAFGYVPIPALMYLAFGFERQISDNISGGIGEFFDVAPQIRVTLRIQNCPVPCRIHIHVGIDAALDCSVLRRFGECSVHSEPSCRRRSLAFQF